MAFSNFIRHALGAICRTSVSKQRGDLPIVVHMPDCIITALCVGCYDSCCLVLASCMSLHGNIWQVTQTHLFCSKPVHRKFVSRCQQGAVSAWSHGRGSRSVGLDTCTPGRHSNFLYSPERVWIQGSTMELQACRSGKPELRTSGPHPGPSKGPDKTSTGDVGEKFVLLHTNVSRLRKKKITARTSRTGHTVNIEDVSR